MEDEKIAEQKSRIFHQRIGSRPEWRSVGSITIISPEHDQPLFLKGVGYTIFLQEAKDKGLRDAFIVLQRWPLWNRLALGIWLSVAAVLGFALARAWYSLYPI